MERFVLTSLDPPPNHTNTCKMCLKNLVSVWSIKNFFFFTDDQEKVQSQKQMLAEQRREEARVQKQIEVAHKEMERLEKYVNINDD